MQYQLTHFDILPDLRILQVNFVTATFQPEDLFWLPHHHRLSSAVKKRQAEHLAGRIAACEALRFHGVKDYVPGMGLQREPCWPPGFSGSITHSGKVALATVIADDPRRPSGVGIDIEDIIAPEVAREISDAIIDSAEKTLICATPFPFHVALTLAFSAKESLFKALFRHAGHYFNFSAASISKIDDGKLTLTLNQALGPFKKGHEFIAVWESHSTQLVTLLRLERE
ncbi:enterobactin synthase subunit EntD [Buttiauxella warmboldiae]|uniref:Enterobactin synthase component D n=1 Tax=Buttiauxella warmboldiae TaxID=82993 RepID=A0A3N5DMA9_9ENTR|nr:enterobactin synthase subunit EntD [Buttiauxella warmboldiae]RPH29708.1 enterobactin synthase subunit EntD [Buttiauxella warmboldiae]